jgi:hypothetical protein
MPAFSQRKTARLRHHAATMTTAATRARDAAHTLRAKAEQNIIDSECRATKLALTQDREAWRVYRRRKRGEPAGDFIPYLT